MKTFERLESQVRSYSRKFPAVFAVAKESRLTDEHGREYLDFFSGAGALNYGHNNPWLKQRLIEYLTSDGITHSLDMATPAKRDFLEAFSQVILEPRKLDYKVQFTGPTGTNAVEAALKLARKVTGRQTVVHFVNSYHGMSLGSLAVNGNVRRRASAGVTLPGALPMLFDGDLGPNADTIGYLNAFLDNPENGVGMPAAVILETIQAEGGVRVASSRWLRNLEEATRRHGILLIVDDIQTGCGRTGDFFSFEEAHIKPDIVCLSKSIGGYGLPMSLVLIRPDIDLWEPGEHTGTFRGNNLAFVTAAAALEYWRDDSFSKSIGAKSRVAASALRRLLENELDGEGEVRGRGLMQGLVFSEPGLAQEVSHAAFERGVIIETCGPRDEVLKFLPPLTITSEELEQGISIVSESMRAVKEVAQVRAAAG